MPRRSRKERPPMSELTRFGRSLQLVPKTPIGVSEVSYDEGFEPLECEIVEGVPVETRPARYVRASARYVAPLECPTCHISIDDAPGTLVIRSERDRLPGGKVQTVPCPTCSGDAMKKRAARRQAELIQRIFGGYQIPWKMRDWEFTSFPKSGDQSALAAVEKFIARHLAGDETLRRGLWLGGDLRPGKTSLAVRGVRRDIRGAHKGLFVLSSDLFDRLHAFFRRGPGDSARWLAR